MKNFVKIFLFISIFLISRCLFSHMYEEKGIEVLHPWSTATDNDGNANAYITISNNTDKEISLIKLDTEISDVYMLMNNEKMVKKLIIPAQSIRSIDDFYIMFHGIKNKLNIGNVFPAKLFFSGDIEIDIKFVVGETTSLDEAEQLMDHNHH